MSRESNQSPPVPLVWSGWTPADVFLLRFFSCAGFKKKTLLKRLTVETLFYVKKVDLGISLPGASCFVFFFTAPVAQVCSAECLFSTRFTAEKPPTIIVIIFL